MKLKKNRKLHGSVLLTVVCVMSLLIVFLFGTLVLATSTNNRAHVNYSSAQTSITSRTVVESTLKAMANDTDFAKAVNSIGKGSAPLSIPVNINATSPSIGSIGHPDDVIIEYAGTKKVFDEAKYAWVDKTVLKITSKVKLGGTDSVTSAYIVKDPAKASHKGGSGGAGFISTGDVNFTTGMNLMGGAYVNMPPVELVDGWELMKYAYDNTAPGTEAYLYPGGNPIHMAQPGADPSPGDGDAKCNVEADFIIWGDFNTKMYQKLIFPTTRKGVTVWGNMLFVSNTNFEFENHLDPDGEYDFAEIPYVYVDQAIKRNPDDTETDTKVYIGTNRGSKVDAPLNIFARSINIVEASEVKLGGDLYLMDSHSTNVISSQNTGGVLYDWSASVISKTYGGAPSTGGNIYSKGSLTLKNMDIKGGVYCEGDLIFTGANKIAGDIACKGTLTVNGKVECSGVVYTNGNPVVSGDGLYIKGTKFTPVDISSIKPGYSYQLNEEILVPKSGYTVVPNHALTLDVNPINENQVRLTLKDGDIVIEQIKIGDNTRDFQNPYNKDEVSQFQNLYARVESDGSLELVPRWYGDSTYICNATTESYSCFNPAGDRVSLNTACDVSYRRRAADGSLTTDTVTTKYSYYNSSGALVDEADAYPENPLLKRVSTIAHVYPEYAERDVILGFAGDDPANSKIVSTFKELYENVCNPYEQTTLPDPMRDQLEDISLGTLTPPIYTSMGDVVADTKVVATGYNADGTIDYDTRTSIDSNNGPAPVITKTCRLRGSFSGNNGTYDLVIRPETDILVILDDGFTLSAQTNIIVDDTAGGVVYFYVPGTGKIAGSETDVAENRKVSNGTYEGKACVMDLNYGGTASTATISTQSSILTSSYKILLTSGRPFQVSTADGVASDTPVPANKQNTSVHYASDGKITPPLLEQMHKVLNLKNELGRPNVEIRGGKEAKTVFNATPYHSVNIISSEMEVEFIANNGSTIDGFWYNNTDMSTVNNSNGPYIFGCVNAHGAASPNEFKNIYVRDKSDADEDDDDDDDEGEDTSGGSGFKILYYDEY